MSTTPPDAGLTPEQASQQLDQAVAAATTAAADQQANTLQTVAFVNQARAARLDRTAAAAVAQNGAGSGQAQAAQAAAAAAKLAAGKIIAAHQQATTSAPTVDPNGWALHGRVYDSAMKPLAQHSVFLSDQQKAYQSAYGFSYTDKSGYFLINAPAPPAGTAQPTGLYVQVADPKANPVYSAATAFTPTAGAASYQTITLPAGEPPLGDPPPAVRASALPPVGKKPKGN
jgi:hypothetical protein